MSGIRIGGSKTHSLAFRSSFSLYVSITRREGGICVARNRTSCTCAHLLCDEPRSPSRDDESRRPSRKERREWMQHEEDASAVLANDAMRAAAPISETPFSVC